MSHKEQIANIIQKLEGMKLRTSEYTEEIGKLQLEEYLQNAINREQYKKTLEAQEKTANEQYRLFQMCERWIRATMLDANIDPGDDK